MGPSSSLTSPGYILSTKAFIFLEHTKSKPPIIMLTAQVSMYFCNFIVIFFWNSFSWKHTFTVRTDQHVFGWPRKTKHRASVRPQWPQFSRFRIEASKLAMFVYWPQKHRALLFLLAENISWKLSRYKCIADAISCVFIINIYSSCISLAPNTDPIAGVQELIYFNFQ